MKTWIKWLLIIGFLATLMFLSVGCHKPLVVAPPAIVAEQPNYNTVVTQMVYKTNWLPTLAILGAGIGIFGFINGSKWAGAAVAACLGSLVLSLAVAQHAYWLATAGLIVAIVLGGYTILVKTKAIKQLITGIQYVRDAFPERKEFVTNLIANEQDDNTKSIVIQEKETLRKEKII